MRQAPPFKSSERRSFVYSADPNLPGPGQYSTSNSGIIKEGSIHGRGGTSWHTRIGAFGTTEKRFVKEKEQLIDTLGETKGFPGPGEYSSESVF